jgi:hypothetical protein
MSAETHGNLDGDPHHEETDINIGSILWFVIVLTTIVLLTDAAMYALFKGLAYYEAKHDPQVSPLFLPAGQPQAPPGLQTEPWTDLKRFRAEADLHLHSYGWVDQKAGVARIPIEKAKEKLLQQGLPVRPDIVDASEGMPVAEGGESNGGRTLPAGSPDRSSVLPPPATAPAAPAPTKPGGGGQ